MDTTESSLQLFPSMSGEGAELRKPHEMIVMIPRTKRVTLTGRKIYNALLHFSQDRLVSMEGMPTADFMFSAPLQSILKVSGSSSETRTVAKRYLREMRGLAVDWETTAPGDGVKWKDFSMLGRASPLTQTFVSSTAPLRRCTADSSLRCRWSRHRRSV